MFFSFGRIRYFFVNFVANKSISLNSLHSIKNFFSKCYQIRSFLWIRSRLLKKSLIENFFAQCSPQRIIALLVSKAYLLIIIFNYGLFMIFHPHFFKTFFLYSIDASLYIAKKSLKLLWFKGNCKRIMCYNN